MPFCRETWFGENLSKKLIESRYIGHFQIIGQIIDIDLILPQIIGDFKELSVKLSISKFEGKLSKNYRYQILGIWELSKNYWYRKLHPILSDKHDWKHCSKNKKGITMINRIAACCQRLLVQQSQHRQFQCLWEVHWWC